MVDRYTLFLRVCKRLVPSTALEDLLVGITKQDMLAAASKSNANPMGRETALYVINSYFARSPPL